VVEFLWVVDEQGVTGSADAAGVRGTAGEYRGPSARTNRGPQDDRGVGLHARRRESLWEGLQVFFQHVVEFLWVIYEQGVTVAVEALQLELVAEF
jgi:hypothetical protein